MASIGRKNGGRAQKYVRDRAWGKRLRRIRGAHAANRAIRLSGRVPGQEARAQVIKNRAARKAAAELERVGYANVGE
jgi:hypothetical protein